MITAQEICLIGHLSIVELVYEHFYVFPALVFGEKLTTMHEPLLLVKKYTMLIPSFPK